MSSETKGVTIDKHQSRVYIYFKAVEICLLAEPSVITTQEPLKLLY